MTDESYIECVISLYGLYKLGAEAHVTLGAQNFAIPLSNNIKIGWVLKIVMIGPHINFVDPSLCEFAYSFF